MLPDGFEWMDRYQYAEGELALVYGGKQVAMLMRKAGGDWFARLWTHWPVTEPLVVRDCSSFEAGKAGIEMWAAKHAARIREEVASGPERP